MVLTIKRLVVLVTLAFAVSCNSDPAPPAPEAPVIEYFRLSPQTVTRGSAVRLEWSVKNAESIEIDAFGPVNRTAGQRTHIPDESRTYTLYARAGDIERMRTRSVEVTEAEEPVELVLWADIERERFGSRNVPGEGELHLGAVDTVDALKALDDTLIWNGIRNPGAALGCGDWSSYGGISRAEMPASIARSDAALSLLRSYAQIANRDRLNVLIGGALFRGPVPKDEWKTAIQDVVRQAIEASGLDGIRSLCE